MNRMRVTKSKRNNRRSHHRAALPAHTGEGGTMRVRHHASRVTGMYRGRKITDIKQKSGKKQIQNDNEKKTVEQAVVPK